MDAQLCPGQVIESTFWPLLFFLLTLSAFTLVILMLIFACVYAYKVKRRNEYETSFHHKMSENEEERDSLLKLELDDKYSNIPEEYIKRKVDFLHNERRFSSNSSSTSSSQFRSRSDSQAAVDTMLHWFVDPEHCGEDQEHGSGNMNLNKALTMFSTTETQSKKSSLKQVKGTGKSRRISWPDEEKHKDNVSQFGKPNSKDRQNTFIKSNTGLEVILEYDA